MGKDGKNSHRISATFSREEHAELERIAKKRGIRIAWLVHIAGVELIERENGGPMLPLGSLRDDRAQR
jgi:hypothetical protein